MIRRQTPDPVAPGRTPQRSTHFVGRDFPLALAQRLASRTLDDTDLGTSAIDRAIRAHLLEPAEALEHFRFVHGLVADVLLRATPVRLPAALHGKLGEILAEQPALRVGGIAASPIRVLRSRPSVHQ